MSARGRFLSGVVTVVLALAGFVGLGALPAAASPPIIPYVALGDSYAAGQGAPPYDLDAACKRSSKGYPTLLNNLESRIQLQANPTCTGATTSSVAITQLPALEPGTKLVTLTVGAANLGLSVVLAACFPTPTQLCQGAIDNVRDNLLPRLGSELTALYPRVAVAAPGARIVVTGYPHLFEPESLPPTEAIIAERINRAIDALNSTIEGAVSVTNAADVNIHYVDVTEEFAGHGIFSTDQFINATGLDAFHPNDFGYQAYRDAISVALPGGWLKQLV